MAEWLVAVDQHAQRLLHGCLALLGGQVQNVQVFPIGTRRHSLPQQVVGQAKTTAGKQFLAVLVVGESARLTYQRVDHVSIVDVLLAAAVQPWQRLHQLLTVPDLQVLQIDPHLDPRAD